MSANSEHAPQIAGTADGIAPVPAPVRTAFGLLERIPLAPGSRWPLALGSRWAFGLWCTPPAPTGPVRLPGGLTAGRQFEVTWSGHTVACESWGQGPPVYLVHGWGGWRGHLGAFVEPLVHAGHRVIAFDLPSHNESGPGELGPGRTTALECTLALQAVVEAEGPAHAVVAHSLGTKVTALAVAWGLPAERLVFLAPMADYALYLDRFARRHGFGPRIRTGLRRRLDGHLGIPLLDTDVPHLAARIEHPPPLLVIHDPDDSEAPYESSQAIVHAWPGSTLVTTRGLGRLAHLRIMRDRQAIRESIAFFQQTGDREGIG